MASHFTKAHSCDAGSRQQATQEPDDRESTREWLETILESYHSTGASEHCPDIEVQDWTIGSVLPVAPTDGSHGSGDACSNTPESSLMELLGIRTQYSVCGAGMTLEMVAKVLPHDPMTRAFIRQWGLDKREIRFYTEVLPALESVCPGLPIPICYHASHKETAESVLVLEDLSGKGFKVEPLTRGLSLSQAAAALRALAKVHAASLLYTSQTKVNMRQKFPYLLTPEQALDSFLSLVNRGLPLLVKFLQNKSEHKGIREKLQDYQSENKISSVIEKAFEPSPKLNTLVHCDFWVNNLLFCGTDDQTLCCIIDWQLVTYGRPAIDLALLLTTSLNPDVRRDSRQCLLTTYWTELKSHLAEMGKGGDEILRGYGLPELREDLKSAEAMAALVMVGSVDLALGVPEREERVLSILRDYFQDGIL